MHEGWTQCGGVFSPAGFGGPKGLRVGFSTVAAGDFGAPEAAERLCGAVGASQLRLLHQVHGVDLVDPEEEGEKPEADGWAGRLPEGVLLAVKAADCLPVLIWSESEPVGAAVHAGWRGAVASIASLAVKRLGVDPAGLHAALGPCICQNCFEVGPEVAEAAGADGRWMRPGKPGKFHMDIAAYVAADLKDAGVMPERIRKLGLCTRCSPDLFWSFRRGDEKKRMVGFLGVVK